MNVRLLIIAIAGIIAGCSSTESVTEDTYKLSSNIVLFDSLGKLIGNSSGVTVSVSGKSVVTDSAGLWNIQVGSSDHSIVSFTKAGFATRYLQLPPNAVRTTTYYIAQPPAFAVTLDAAAIAESDTPGVDAGFIMYGHYPSAPSGTLAWGIRVMLSRKSEYDPNDTTAVEAFFEPPYVEKNGDITNFNFYIGYNQIAQFKSADSIFIRAYPKGFVSTYIDPDENHKDIFPYGQPSNTLVVVRQ